LLCLWQRELHQFGILLRNHLQHSRAHVGRQLGRVDVCGLLIRKLGGLPLQPGLLSSSPLLWPSFYSPLSIAKINDYLSVYEAVNALPACQKAKMITVGNQLRLVPQAIFKSTDLPKERAEKRKKLSQLTSQYYTKGLALVQNAARGVFPSTVPVRKIR
jgi:hypothetical protein